MRILMAASGDFAWPTFVTLHHGGHEFVALITQPDRPAGRGRHLHVGRMKEAALERRVPVLQPERLATPEMTDQVAQLAPDLLFVAAYGQKVPPEMCKLPACGGINLHASLLPALRGAAPANWAIMRGLKRTGVTVMYLAERMDAGDILGQRETAIGPRETAGELLERLATLGAELVADVVAQLEAGTQQAAPQDESLVTQAPRLHKENGLIDWARPARELDWFIRGLQPWPGAFTHLGGLRIIIEQAAPLEDRGCPGLRPGLVIESVRHLVVGTGQGGLELLSVKPQSRTAMSAEAFCNGHAVCPGIVLG